MSDGSGFTSAALLGWAVLMLRARDPALLPADVRADDWLGVAHASAALKRRVLTHALERGGPGAILAIGASIPEAPAIPALQVLQQAPDTRGLAERWMRLERYYHSGNRTRIDDSGDAWTCTRSGPAGREPVAAENLVILSVLVGLLGRFGCRGIRASIGRAAMYPEVPRRCPAATNRWRIRWERAPAPRRPPAGTTGAGVPAMARLPEPAASVAAMLASDVARRCRLDEIARRLGRSARSLQRDLNGTGHSFSSLSRAVRVDAAAELLAAGQWSLADVGYAAGFADQAHFQREFRRVAGMTPADFRRQAAG